MGVPDLEVGYTSTTTGRGDHEVHKGHVVALGKKIVEDLLLEFSDKLRHIYPTGVLIQDTTAILAQPTDITRTQYTKRCLCSAS
jgi:hypothetical protein